MNSNEWKKFNRKTDNADGTKRKKKKKYLKSLSTQSKTKKKLINSRSYLIEKGERKAENGEHIAMVNFILENIFINSRSARNNKTFLRFSRL